MYLQEQKHLDCSQDGLMETQAPLTSRLHHFLFFPCKYLSNRIYSALILRDWNAAEAVKLSLGALEVMIKHCAEENPGDVGRSAVHVPWKRCVWSTWCSQGCAHQWAATRCPVLLSGQPNKLSSIFLMRSSQLYSSKFLEMCHLRFSLPLLVKFLDKFPKLKCRQF